MDKKLKRIFERAEEKYFIPWSLLAAFAERRSGLDPAHVSERGEFGLMGFTQADWTQWGQGDPLDPRDNVEAGARYLYHLYDIMLRNMRTDFRWALAGWLLGPYQVLTYETWDEVPIAVREAVEQVIKKARELHQGEEVKKEDAAPGKKSRPGAKRRRDKSPESGDTDLPGDDSGKGGAEAGVDSPSLQASVERAPEDSGEGGG